VEAELISHASRKLIFVFPLCLFAPKFDLFPLMLLSVEHVVALSRSQFPANVPRKQPFARHLSFDQICEVATIEHEKLSSVEGSQHNYYMFFTVHL